MKKMSLKEFVDLGLLQEINRLFLHPMGLALSMKYPTLGTEEELDTPLGFGDVLDARDDPEGLIFSADNPDFTRKKAERVANLFEAKKAARLSNLGYFIQEAPERKEP